MLLTRKIFYIKYNRGKIVIITGRYAPSMERLKQPNRSPARESAPHWRTMAPGEYISTTFEIIYKIAI